MPLSSLLFHCMQDKLIICTVLLSHTQFGQLAFPGQTCTQLCGREITNNFGTVLAISGATGYNTISNPKCLILSGTNIGQGNNKVIISLGFIMVRTVVYSTCYNYHPKPLVCVPLPSALNLPPSH